jgi:hypothetical protein
VAEVRCWQGLGTAAICRPLTSAYQKLRMGISAPGESSAGSDLGVALRLEEGRSRSGRAFLMSRIAYAVLVNSRL